MGCLEIYWEPTGRHNPKWSQTEGIFSQLFLIFSLTSDNGFWSPIGIHLLFGFMKNVTSDLLLKIMSIVKSPTNTLIWPIIQLPNTPNTMTKKSKEICEISISLMTTSKYFDFWFWLIFRDSLERICFLIKSGLIWKKLVSGPVKQHKI